MNMPYTREYFEEQARQLRLQCAVRRELRKLQRQQDASRAGRIARRLHRLGAHEADLISDSERRRIRSLKRKGLGIEQIAREMKTDIVTVAVVVEGLL